jgi:uncharacterized protein
MKNSMSKKTVVIGASDNPSRYAYMATMKLKSHGHEVVPIGVKKGSIDGVEIRTGQPPLENVHTITLYLRASRQKELYDYFLSLKPKRIIFNPGAENEELEQLAEKNGIEATEACTLVLLGIGAY